MSDLDSRLNVIVGANAQGKTTFLEALSLGMSLKSFRTSRISELVRFNSNEACVVIDLIKPSASRILIGIQNNRRTIKVDHKTITSKSHYPFFGSSVSFVPDDLHMVKGSPDQRRSFLDDLGLSLDENYALVLQRFERAQKQRNKVLKNFKDGQGNPSELELWTSEFITCSIPVYEGRQKIVRILNEQVPMIYSKLFQTPEVIRLHYDQRMNQSDDSKSYLEGRLRELREAEIAVGYTLAGPHKDDLVLLINESDARTYASQGQMRSLVIALKIAHVELIRQYKKWPPILLLDDIISELDDRRVQSLIGFLSQYSGQLFVTTAEMSKMKALHDQFKTFKLIDLRSNDVFDPYELSQEKAANHISSQLV